MTTLQPAPPSGARGLSRVRRLRARVELFARTPLGPLSVAAAAAGAMGVLQVADPNEAGHYPSCPFLSVTGLLCPGCGSLRMLHALGAGDVVAAFWLNPLGLLLLPTLVAYWVAWLRRTVTGRPRGAPLHAAWVWAFLVVTASYWVARNLPGLELLAPGPPPGG
ncbi:DUF2752 domain-containing protein [Aquipuribacter sp. SD81]|uniref:DUF2752 domain-containing protein n=1 Tax=Aquipuribacter sp. SD81 TaxID=3127703 RepID=UPI00301697F4